jgi:Fe2+ transport system protein FeoA
MKTDGGKPLYLHCTLCGLEFEKTETVCAHGCPMGLSCNHVRCPNCNFEFPEPPRSTRWLGRMFRRRRRHRHGQRGGNGETTTLDRMRSGERCKLHRLGCNNSGRRNTLTVFGMTPGTEFVLLQRHPSYVIRIGETELGLDEEIAREIHVKPI